MNIRELSKGSFVQAWSNDSAWLFSPMVVVIFKFTPHSIN